MPREMSNKSTFTWLRTKRNNNKIRYPEDKLSLLLFYQKKKKKLQRETKQQKLTTLQSKAEKINRNEEYRK